MHPRRRWRPGSYGCMARKLDTRRPHGERGEHPRLYKQGHPKVCQFECSGRRGSNKKRKQPAAGGEAQFNNDDGVLIRTHSSGGAIVLHRFNVLSLLTLTQFSDNYQLPISLNKNGPFRRREFQSNHKTQIGTEC
ncbi:hypothetical protein EVAR_70285_1 [Eumeta japonica]|uniref:Uncharacterized protein n=1 Tax=Eumeta variegata TaxID=151549 RepID=A0A4C2ADK0_EUMVA|nr:hypothetical protein EVAR_70285_1 [Eumeta japonica]